MSDISIDTGGNEIDAGIASAPQLEAMELLSLNSATRRLSPQPEGLLGILPEVLLAQSSHPESPAQCPDNPLYRELIDKVARNIYDPRLLGDVESLYSQFNCQISTDEEAISFADRALRRTNDPYTDILTPAEVARLSADLQGNLVGIGVMLGPSSAGESDQPGHLRIEEVIDGGPAQEAGIVSGDIITHINGRDIGSLSPRDSIPLLQGPAGSGLNVTIERDGRATEIAIERENIDIPAVTEELLPGNLLYIRVNTFVQQDTAQEFAQAVARHPDAEGYIIDLRDNGGGLMRPALEMATQIMDEGTILQTRKRVESDPSTPQYRNEIIELTDSALQVRDTDTNLVSSFDRPEDIIDRPVVVLVNEGTASSAEIFAAALQDNQEATILGTKTFGKGVAQSLYQDGPGGTWIKVTSTHYYTPEGRWLGDGYNNRNGIDPDIEVADEESLNPEDDFDEQLESAISFLNRR